MIITVTIGRVDTENEAKLVSVDHYNFIPLPVVNFQTTEVTHHDEKFFKRIRCQSLGSFASAWPELVINSL